MMPAGQQIPQDAAPSANGHSTVHDLFVLTDEQILEIEPEIQDARASGPKETTPVAPASLPAGSNETARNENHRLEASATASTAVASAAERARVLDDIDRSYFGATGKSAEEVSATRAELAQRMMRENPAAFREMVFAGLRALENAGVGATPSSRAEARDGSPGTNGGVASAGGASPVPTAAASSGRRDSQNTELQARDTGHEAHLAAYSAFEKAANEDLERSVGGAIERTLAQALPNVGRNAQDASIRTGQAPPVQARLNAAIRQDVETALKGDRQLGEQVAQILSGRRLDVETRAQIVRLIGERAQQLVPIAAKRVLNDWTQTTLAAHRGNTARGEAASSRREVAPASTDSRGASLQSSNSTNSGRDPSRGANLGPGRSDTRRVDYRKLSDEQILEM